MKKPMLLLSLFVFANVAFAQQPETPVPADSDKAAVTPEIKEFPAKVVAVDPDAKTITLAKSDEVKVDGKVKVPPKILAVASEAAPVLKTLKPGENVKVIARTDGSGQEKVTVLAKVKVRTPTKK